tara:strand:+ start:1284 stop:1532 length:249 start_codon:yes stop_codon:yes gene_type:complete
MTFNPKTHVGVAEPIPAFANFCSNVGWDTKLSELTESQMIGLIFILQEARSITYGHKDIENLELEHVKWSGGHWPPSTGIPF